MCVYDMKVCTGPLSEYQGTQYKPPHLSSWSYSWCVSLNDKASESFTGMSFRVRMCSRQHKVPGASGRGVLMLSATLDTKTVQPVYGRWSMLLFILTSFISLRQICTSMLSEFT